MKNKQIFIAFIILVLLGSYYYIFEVKKKQEDIKKKENEEKLFPDLKKENITEVQVINKNGKFVFKKSGNDWEMIEPIKDFADNSSVDSIANSYANKKGNQRIEKANPADFGLTKTAEFIETEIKTSDNKVYKLNIGDKNPTGSYVYVQKPEMPDTVYMTESDFRTWCEKSLFDYRYKYLLKVDEEKINKIIVNTKEKKYTLEKTQDGWQMISPFKDIARKDRISSLIGSFKSAMAKSMEKPTEENLKKYKLKNPSEYIKFIEGDKEHIIYIGAGNKEKYSYYMRTNRIDDILEMPDYIYNNLLKADEIRNKQIVIFSQEMVKKIEIKYGDKYILAEKVKDKKGIENWEYKQTKNIDKNKIKNISMYTVSSELFNSDYKEKIKEDDKINEKEKYGIEKDNRFIRLYEANDKVIGTVLIGSKIKDKDEIYVKVPERKEIYIIESRHITNLSLPDFEIK